MLCPHISLSPLFQAQVSSYVDMHIGSIQPQPTLREKQRQKSDVLYTMYIEYAYIFGVKWDAYFYE